MGSVLSLTVPFFGLVLFGFLAGKWVKTPASGLAWLNIFIIYFALPALFFQLVAQTPFNELSNLGFVFAVVGATGSVFALSFAIAFFRSRFNIAQATINALSGAYANNGYLGPGLALSALGAAATAPVALIFAIENTMFFILTPILMAMAGAQNTSAVKTTITIARRIFTHPFILAVIAGITAAAFEWQPPEIIDRLLTMLRGAAAPCALFAMGVTVALQTPPSRDALADLSIFLTIKLLVHPLVAFVVVSTAKVDPLWLTTAVLMAA
ncbi:MAG: AEC family transporter, partial [Pseudomonadota bacterium]